MKTYAGVPGDKPMIMVVEGGVTKSLVGDFGWGTHVIAGRKLPDPKGREAAKAILLDYFNGDEHATNRMFTRFQHRVIVPLQADKPLKITSLEIAAVLKEIGDTERETAGAISKVDMEPAPIAREGGIGPGGVPFSPIELKG